MTAKRGNGLLWGEESDERERHRRGQIDGNVETEMTARMKEGVIQANGDVRIEPTGEMRKLYEALGLPKFENVEPTLRTYIHSLSDYRKNTFPKLASDVQRRVAGEWGRCFEEWGYPV
jgi:hypothetical protein